MRNKFIVHLNLIKFNVHLKQWSRKYRPLKPETTKQSMPHMEIVKSTVLESTPFKFIKSYEIEIVLAKNDDFRVTQLGCVLKFMHK